MLFMILIICSVWRVWITWAFFRGSQFFILVEIELELKVRNGKSIFKKNYVYYCIHINFFPHLQKNVATCTGKGNNWKFLPGHLVWLDLTCLPTWFIWPFSHLSIIRVILFTLIMGKSLSLLFPRHAKIYVHTLSC